MNSETNEMVAIKKIANAFDNYMDAKRTLREIKLASGVACIRQFICTISETFYALLASIYDK